MPQEPSTTEKTFPKQRRRGVRVLVVDDYLDNAKSMAMLLRLCGHEVEIKVSPRIIARYERQIIRDAKREPCAACKRLVGMLAARRN